ncbi:hypothetical protein DERP_005060 [Dermatophagoides pteronyssinus]|uniref:Uncharacterized protein n=1 Tax=Dermatophagoides pteronyssinus TaxID=6956 RepID=A0ABQ8JT96_DERPT|nr:hypothetical protein DERP_005060 [Dermatophagoides pteronyssinus]
MNLMITYMIDGDGDSSRDASLGIDRCVINRIKRCAVLFESESNVDGSRISKNDERPPADDDDDGERDGGGGGGC